MTHLPLHRISFERGRELLQMSENADPATPAQILIDENAKSFGAPGITYDKVMAYQRMTAEHPDFGLIRVYWPKKKPQDHAYSTVK